MIPARFFTDEDIHGDVAATPRVEGFDALSTPEAGRLGAGDIEQLEWAAGSRRVLVTFNVTDFARLHHAWMNQGRSHAGLGVSRQRPIGDLIRRLVRLGRTLSADDLRDRLEYLSNWPPGSACTSAGCRRSNSRVGLASRPHPTCAVLFDCGFPAEPFAK